MPILLCLEATPGGRRSWAKQIDKTRNWRRYFSHWSWLTNEFWRNMNSKYLVLGMAGGSRYNNEWQFFVQLKTLIICLRLCTITDKKSEECFSTSVFDDMQCVSLQTNILHTFSVLIHICKRAQYSNPLKTFKIIVNTRNDYCLIY